MQKHKAQNGHDLSKALDCTQIGPYKLIRDDNNHKLVQSWIMFLHA